MMGLSPVDTAHRNNNGTWAGRTVHATEGAGLHRLVTPDAECRVAHWAGGDRRSVDALVDRGTVHRGSTVHRGLDNHGHRFLNYATVHGNLFDTAIHGDGTDNRVRLFDGNRHSVSGTSHLNRDGNLFNIARARYHGAFNHRARNHRTGHGVRFLDKDLNRVRSWNHLRDRYRFRHREGNVFELWHINVSGFDDRLRNTHGDADGFNDRLNHFHRNGVGTRNLDRDLVWDTNLDRDANRNRYPFVYGNLNLYGDSNGHCDSHLVRHVDRDLVRHRDVDRVRDIVRHRNGDVYRHINVYRLSNLHCVRNVHRNRDVHGHVNCNLHWYRNGDLDRDRLWDAHHHLNRVRLSDRFSHDCWAGHHDVGLLHNDRLIHSIGLSNVGDLFLVSTVHGTTVHGGAAIDGGGHAVHRRGDPVNRWWYTVHWASKATTVHRWASNDSSSVQTRCG